MDFECGGEAIPRVIFSMCSGTRRRAGWGDVGNSFLKCIAGQHNSLVL